jgi:hypothetical protein
MTQSTETPAAFQRRVLIARAGAMHWPGGVVASGMPINATPSSWQRRINHAPPAELEEIARQLETLEARASRVQEVNAEFDRRRTMREQAAADVEVALLEHALQRRALRRSIERTPSEAYVRSTARRSGEA